MLRLLDVDSGSIKIDDVDIATVPGELIRSKVAAIPQDPIRLPGSVRYNLDPAAASRDEDMISVLETVNLWSNIKDRGGLDVDIDKVAFSRGQQQVFALATALLRRNAKLIILDEPTSSLDRESAELLSRVLLGSAFAGRTIVAVTHRLEGIEAWDKIAVMDQGTIIEFDTPSALLGRNSALRRLRDGGEAD